MTGPSIAFPMPGIAFGEYPERRDGGAARPARSGAPRPACGDTLDFLSGIAAAHLGHAPHAGQRAAALALLARRMVEMDTGEGKTLAIALAAATAALAGSPVHVVTANDYLAARDAEALAGFYAAAGLTVAATRPGEPRERRAAAYGADVVYATARELAFDYLRDGLATPGPRAPIERRARRLAGFADPHAAPLLRGLCVAIVDEADTVLIDEARVPLVLSRALADDPDRALYAGALALARGLVDGRDCHLDRRLRAAALTDAGRARLASLPAAAAGVARDARHREELVCQALAALHFHLRDRDYVVKDGAVAIVDETTGRDARGRAWSRGLHQLVELKEGLDVSARGGTVAQITCQSFFRRYLHLCGISGTLAECAREMHTVYGLATQRVPPRRPSRRRALPCALFDDEAALVAATVARARAVAAAGRAVLIGSGSVAQSDRLSRALREAGLDHARLDARHDAGEAAIVAAAGRAGRITVATSMAGRGTDIAVDPDVLAKGGLHVILLQHNTSPRIDRQFIGRTARRGEPGSHEILRAVDSALFSRHLPPRLRRAIAALARRAPGVARLAGAWPQWREESIQRAQRVSLMRADLDAARLLAFSGDGP